MRAAKRVKVTMMNEEVKEFDSSKAFCNWYCSEKGWGPASGNCNFYGMVTGKLQTKLNEHGIEKVEYI